VLVKSDINFNTLYDVVNNTFLRQGSKAPFNKKKLQHFIEMLIVEKRFVSFAALTDLLQLRRAGKLQIVDNQDDVF